MYRPLSPCPSCLRHIVATEARCPFCSHALSAPLPVRPDATRRLSRAAVFSFAASLGVAGCSSSVTTTDASAGVDRPATDAPAESGVADTGPADTGIEDIGNIAPPYGIPAPDAGPPDDDGGMFDLYGSPPDAGR